MRVEWEWVGGDTAKVKMAKIGQVRRNARIRLSSKVRLGCDDMEK
jgi:hypothetical protein